MRLIDADELIEHAWRDKLDSRELIVQMIKNAPTIKEIPTNIPINIFERLIELAESNSTIDTQPKTGHWIRWYEGIDRGRCIDRIPHCKCSECGKEYDPHSSQFIKYCCECGARMFELQKK